MRDGTFASSAATRVPTSRVEPAHVAKGLTPLEPSTNTRIRAPDEHKVRRAWRAHGEYEGFNSSAGAARYSSATPLYTDAGCRPDGSRRSGYVRAHRRRSAGPPGGWSVDANLWYATPLGSQEPVDPSGGLSVVGRSSCHLLSLSTPLDDPFRRRINQQPTPGLDLPALTWRAPTPPTSDSPTHAVWNAIRIGANNVAGRPENASPGADAGESLCSAHTDAGNPNLRARRPPSDVGAFSPWSLRRCMASRELTIEESLRKTSWRVLFGRLSWHTHQSPGA